VVSVSETPEIDIRRLFQRKGAAHALRRLQAAWEKVDTDLEQQQVLDRIEDLSSPLLLFVVGEGNFGKSSLVNALLGTKAAPVSILPKTWKVDVYQSCQNGEAPTAALKWVDKDHVEIVSMEHAQAVVTEQEELTSQQKGDSPGSFSSALLEVRWTSPDYQLPSDVVLVDTPGFSQLRSDVDINDVHVRSAQGIRISARQAFDYWYHRADVVLWVFKATRLNDKDTVEAISELSRHGRTIIGVVTHMDRVPADRWEEVLGGAQALFGQFVEAIYPVVAKVCGAEADESVAALRSKIDEHFFSRARENKMLAIEQFLRQSGSQLISWVSTEHDAIERNLDILNKTRSALAQIGPFCLANGRGIVLDWRERRMGAALQRCGVGFATLPADDSTLQSMMNAIIRSDSASKDLQQRLESEAFAAIAEFRKTSQQLDLVGVRFSGDEAEVFVQAPDYSGSTVLNVSATSSRSSISNVLSGREGLEVGFGAGAIGAALLGPMGWGLAIVGLIFSDEIKKSKLRNHTKKMIKEWYPSKAQSAMDDFGMSIQNLYNRTDEAVMEAFQRFCGEPPDGLLERSVLYERKIIRPLAVRPPSLMHRIGGILRRIFIAQARVLAWCVRRVRR